MDEDILARPGRAVPTPDNHEACEEREGCPHCLGGWALLGSLDHDGKEVVDAVRCRRCGGEARRRGVGTGTKEVHHAAPRCLLRLWDRANGSLPDPDVSPAWLEWADEAGRWGVPVAIDRGDLAELVARSAEVLDRERHRLLHESDWQRWGRRGGLATVRRYGRSWMALLVLRRWGRIDEAALEAARPLR